VTDPTARWTRVTVAGWYGEAARDIALATGTAVWYHPGLPVVPIRWVLVRAIPSAASIRKRSCVPT
jgi:hypothetical protein